MKSNELLRVAMHALRDLDAGCPADEIAYPPYPEEDDVPQASGLCKLIGAIALHLAASGDLDAEDRGVVIGLLPDLPLPAPSQAEIPQDNTSAGRAPGAMQAPPSPESPHYRFYLHIVQGGRVYRDDRLNNIKEWLDLDSLGDPAKIKYYGYRDLSIIDEPAAEAAESDSDAGEEGSLRPIPNPFADKSISDDDICSDCKHCLYSPGNLSLCSHDWPGSIDPSDRVVQCPSFDKIA